MTGSNPDLVVRVGANLEDLKKNLAEGTTHLETMVAAAIGLQTKLVLAEAAAAAAGTTMRSLAAGITEAGTATEAQVNALAAATAKWLALKGAVVSAKDDLAALRPVAEEVSGSVGNLRGALNAFDGVLAAVGIHLGPEIRGLGELGDAAGKTVSQLGGIATVGLAVGAALGGWKIGRVISDFFDLDTVIGNATAKLLGWGDAAGQTAGARADVLARASQLAGYAVTDLTTAMGINAVSFTAWRSNVEISAAAVAGWRAELAKVASGGELASLTADLKSHNFSVKDLADRYHVSVDALQFFTRETAAASEAEKAHAEVIKAANATKMHALREEIAANQEAARVEAAGLLVVTRLQDEYNLLRVEHGGTATDIQIAQIHKWADDLTARMVKAKTDTREFYDWLAITVSEKLRGVSVDWKALEGASIETLLNTAAKAQATFNEATTGSLHFSQAAIQHFRNVRDEAVSALHETAAEHQAAFVHMRDDVDRTSFTFRAWLANAATDADKAALGINKVAAATLAAAAAAKKAHEEMLAMGGTFDVAHAARDPRIMELLHAGWSLENAMAIKLGQDWGFQPKLFSPNGSPESQPDPNERVPGYIKGTDGFVDFGAGTLAMLHGREAVVPESAVRGGGIGGSTTHTHNYYITQPLATPQQLVAAIDDAIMKRQRASGSRI